MPDKERWELSALQAAILQGDRSRSVCVLAGLGLIAIIVALRTAVEPAAMRQGSAFLVFLGFLLAYEAGMLLVIVRAIRAGRDLSHAMIFANGILEGLIVTAALAMLMAYQDQDRRLALSAPAVLVYFYFFAASSLRMTPYLNAVQAALAVMGYGGLALYAHAHAGPSPQSGVWLISPAVHATSAALILAGGLLSAAVAARIRRYVVIGIRDAAARERMERELDVARKVQTDLLPKEPLTIPGYALAGWSQAANETGGDYYDWLSLPDGRAMISIADASGHGLGPALMVTVCRAYFRAAAQVDMAIEHAVGRVNDLICLDMPEGAFVTAAVAALDPSSHQLQVFSAGHGPILYYRAGDEQVLSWNADVMPLGMFKPMAPDPSRGMPMAPGDMLLLVTDGVFEWVDPDGRQYGLERLAGFLLQYHASEPEEFIQALRADVLAFVRGTVQMDDLTIVVLKRSVSV